MSERQNCFWGATVYSYTAEKGSRRFNKYINAVKMVLYDLLVCYLAFIALISTTYGHILLHLSPLWIFLWSWLLCQRYLLFFFVKSYLIEPVRVECIFSHLALSFSLLQKTGRVFKCACGSWHFFCATNECVADCRDVATGNLLNYYVNVVNYNCALLTSTFSSLCMPARAHAHDKQLTSNQKTNQNENNTRFLWLNRHCALLRAHFLMNVWQSQRWQWINRKREAEKGEESEKQNNHND